MIRIVIVSDIRLYREGLADILDRERSISVCDIVSSVDGAIGTITQQEPDVVILDMTMIHGDRVLNTIVSSHPQIKLITLALSEDDDAIYTCAKAGVAGYVSRDATLKELLDTIHGVMKGEHCCPKHIAESLFHKLKVIPHTEDNKKYFGEAYEIESRISRLTKREKEIAALLSDGLSNKQIANNLTIEVSTVKNHVHNILTKIGAHNRLHAVKCLQNQAL